MLRSQPPALECPALIKAAPSPDPKAPIPPARQRRKLGAAPYAEQGALACMGPSDPTGSAGSSQGAFAFRLLNPFRKLKAGPQTEAQPIRKAPKRLRPATDQYALPSGKQARANALRQATVYGKAINGDSVGAVCIRCKLMRQAASPTLAKWRFPLACGYRKNSGVAPQAACPRLKAGQGQ